MDDEIVEVAALVLFNRMRVRRKMQPVDYIGANNTPECNECREEARAALASVYPLIVERCAKVADRTFPRGSAHTYASENADIYRAQEDAAARIAAAIRKLKDAAPRNRKPGAVALTGRASLAVPAELCHRKPTNVLHR